MLWLAALAIVVPKPPGGVLPPVVQARATVRVLSGVRLDLASRLNSGAPKARDTTIYANGAKQAARLIEFE
jgi:hypothetical protein